MVTADMKLKDTYSFEEKFWPTYKVINKQRHYFINKGLSSQSYGFSSSNVWMWDLDHKADWMEKNWCFQTILLEKTLEIPYDSKMKSVNAKGNQPWIFIVLNGHEFEKL